MIGGGNPIPLRVGIYGGSNKRGSRNHLHTMTALRRMHRMAKRQERARYLGEQKTSVLPPPDASSATAAATTAASRTPPRVGHDVQCGLKQAGAHFQSASRMRFPRFAIPSNQS